MHCLILRFLTAKAHFHYVYYLVILLLFFARGVLSAQRVASNPAIIKLCPYPL
jgi:hypothetical protein